jgi:hypothetical protein
LREFDEVRDEVLKEILSHADDSSAYLNAQFRFLILGAVLFIVWHVWEMFARTYGASWWAR